MKYLSKLLKTDIESIKRMKLNTVLQMLAKIWNSL